MNRLLLLIIFLAIAGASNAQPTGYLFVKKGYHKKRTYTEGDQISLQLQEGTILRGVISLLRNDTIFLNGFAIPRANVAAILLSKRKNRFPATPQTLLLIAAGSALTTVGLTINDRNSFKDAAIAGAVIGFGPLIVKYLARGVLRSLQRGRYKIGKKYYLQVLDFHLPNKRAF